MTSIVVPVPTKGDLTFDLNNEIIFVEDTIDDLTGQEIYNAARDVEDDAVVLSFERIVNGAGKTFLGSTSLGSKLTGTTVTLLRGWHVQTQKTSGSLIVFDANVVNETDGSLIFNEVPGVSQVNILIADGVETVVNVGSGLTATEQAQLLDIYRRLGLDSSNPLVTNDDNSITVGPIQIDAVNDATSTTQTRSP